MNECTSIAGHFDGHTEAFKQFMRHCPMEYVQRHIGSHWKPPSGNYSLRIAPADARTTINHTTMNNYTYFAGRFDGHRNVAVRYRTHCQWRRSGASQEAAGCHHRVSTCSNSIKGTCQHRFFWCFPLSVCLTWMYEEFWGGYWASIVTLWYHFHSTSLLEFQNLGPTWRV